MSSRHTVTVINGPNLAGIGIREPDLYGTTDESELRKLLDSHADALGLDLIFEQYDCEGEIVSAIWKASDTSQALIINPGGYSHYSVAILDAVKAFDGQVVEVHISQIFARESFRSNLVTATGASAFIAGAGIAGYLLALDLVHGKYSGETGFLKN